MSDKDDHELFERDLDDPKRDHPHPLVKLALELGPLVVFFFANARFDIFVATAAFMAAITVALAASWILTKRLAIMPVVTGVVVLVFGTLTLFLHDDVFIKMKPTIVNALFGAVLLGGLVFGRSLLGYVFDSVFRLDAEGWRKLTFRWGLFFFALAILNEVVWRNFSTDFWVSFKVFGIMPLTIVFTLTQMPLINRHATEPLGGGK
ncbi:septation protein A [Afifella sp. IM 167]|uniref:septation protein A n=1 Tax=Afifella sp. IM 167 TaxID=2033586 RepID=UPI001CCE3183|nr:septation protein A [Afifella sp. IM 167]MBZ8132800.1 septation protein A [Afifella sp. IM 167]